VIGSSPRHVPYQISSTGVQAGEKRQLLPPSSSSPQLPRPAQRLARTFSASGLSTSLPMGQDGANAGINMMD